VQVSRYEAETPEGSSAFRARRERSGASISRFGSSKSALGDEGVVRGAAPHRFRKTIEVIGGGFVRRGTSIAIAGSPELRRYVALPVRSQGSSIELSEVTPPAASRCVRSRRVRSTRPEQGHQQRPMVDDRRQRRRRGLTRAASRTHERVHEPRRASGERSRTPRCKPYAEERREACVARRRDTACFVKKWNGESTAVAAPQKTAQARCSPAHSRSGARRLARAIAMRSVGKTCWLRRGRKTERSVTWTGMRREFSRAGAVRGVATGAGGTFASGVRAGAAPCRVRGRLGGGNGDGNLIGL
jgi:hypothetical protein